MKIYIGNLNWDMTEADLNELFATFGQVAFARIPRDKYKANKSKGFGFVEMPNNEEGLKAIEALNNTEVKGRKVMVSESIKEN